MSFYIKLEKDTQCFASRCKINNRIIKKGELAIIGSGKPFHITHFEEKPSKPKVAQDAEILIKPLIAMAST